MAYIRLAMQECKPGTVEALTSKAEQTFVPRVQAIPGLISYEVSKVDDRRLLAIGYFETREGAEQLERLGKEWRKDVGKDDVVSVQVHIGEILLEAKPKPEAKQTQATV